MTDRLVIGILAALTALLILIAAFSLQWRMVHDSAHIFYLTFLIDHYHWVPYKDFFNENTPGIYLVYFIVGRVFGYTDLGLRCADLLYLAAILLATGIWVRRIDRRAAWFAAVLFGLRYLSYGSAVSLQRDYVVILPIAVALIISSSDVRLCNSIRGALVGLSFGFCALIKPQGAMAFPLVLIFQILDKGQYVRDKRSVLKCAMVVLAAALLGFALPLVVACAYLVKNGALDSFLEIASNYWPLHNEVTGYRAILTGFVRVKYLFWNYIFLGGMRLWLVPAAMGAYISLTKPGLAATQRRQIKLLVGLVICYSIYVLPAAKFWGYHWLPFSYFIILLSSLCAIRQPRERSVMVKRLPIVILLMTAYLAVRLPHKRYLNFLNQIRGKSPEPPQVERVDEIAAYLKDNLRPGDRVQPIEGAGGAVQAMLMTKAQLATPFPCETCFCHHVSRPYIQGLRRQFIESMLITTPRFVVRIDPDVPWFFGPDTCRDFPELRFILDANYGVVYKGRGYKIYESRTSVQR